MKITLEWLNANRTARGGFNRYQVEALGLIWPPEHDWLRRQVGREITEDQAKDFSRKSAYLLPWSEVSA